MKKTELPLAITCFHLSLAIILGALGAHKLKELLAPESLAAFKTGVEYHLYHGIALLGLFTIPYFRDLQGIKTVRALLGLGIVCFSGSIYLLSTGSLTGLDSLGKVLGPITPVGGILFICGWMLLGIKVLKQQAVSPGR